MDRAVVALGAGRALFAGLPHRIDLSLAELIRVDDGTFVVRYDVKRAWRAWGLHAARF